MGAITVLLQENIVKIQALCWLTVICFVLAGGCYTDITIKTFHEGSVIVELVEQRVGSDDYMTFRFQKKGKYDLTFSHDPNARFIGGTDMPEDFSVQVTAIPYVRIIAKRLLRCIRVTIVHNGVEEYRDLR